MAEPDVTRAQQYSQELYGDQTYYATQPTDQRGFEAPGGVAHEYWTIKKSDPSFKGGKILPHSLYLISHG